MFIAIGKLVQRSVEIHVQTHPQGMAARQPPVLTPHTQDQHRHDRLLADDRAEQRRSGDTLRFFQAAVERRTERACKGTEFSEKRTRD
jgi:hypothetical protein